MTYMVIKDIETNRVLDKCESFYITDKSNKRSLSEYKKRLEYAKYNACSKWAFNKAWAEFYEQGIYPTSTPTAPNRALDGDPNNYEVEMYFLVKQEAWEKEWIDWCDKYTIDEQKYINDLFEERVKELQDSVEAVLES